jgi:hypothetical protein
MPRDASLDFWSILEAVMSVAYCTLAFVVFATFGTSSAWSQVPPSQAQPNPGDSIWKAVDAALGRAGQPQPGGVQKYSFPRSDLTVMVNNVTLKPALALGSWIAFKRTGREAVAMGDLVLTEQEVMPVLSKLQELGIEQTALHNHVLEELPRIMYLHIEGHGDPTKMAEAVRAALALTGTPPPKQATSGTGAFALDTAQVAHALGYQGKVNGGVYQVSVPRAEAIHAHGFEVPPAMGLATAINFQPTEPGKAAITGDFVMTAREVSPVIRELRAAGIAVTALHSHMLSEEPRLFFMHFWAHDDAMKLARGLHAALKRTNVKRARP